VTLATVIREAYRQGEARDVWQALRQLLPVDSTDWSPTGVYCFWDPDSREALYVGLAKNLANRFAQHNSLVSHPDTGNKRRKIAEWFQHHDRLGYSIVVQSAAVVILEAFGLETAGEIAGLGEGQLIEAYSRQYGKRPPWNRISGSIAGASHAGPLTGGYFDLLTGRVSNLFVARRSLRQLAEEPESVDHEMTLHGARMHALEEGFFRGQGVGDNEIVQWLKELLVNRRWGDDPLRHLALVASGYMLLDPPRY